MDTCETIKVYKGRKDVTINLEDLSFWRGNGWETSADRQAKPKKAKKEVTDGND